MKWDTQEIHISVVAVLLCPCPKAGCRERRAVPRWRKGNGSRGLYAPEPGLARDHQAQHSGVWSLPASRHLAPLQLTSARVRLPRRLHRTVDGGPGPPARCLHRTVNMGPRAPSCLGLGLELGTWVPALK